MPPSGSATFFGTSPEVPVGTYTIGAPTVSITNSLNNQLYPPSKTYISPSGGTIILNEGYNSAGFTIDFDCEYSGN